MAVSYRKTVPTLGLSLMLGAIVFAGTSTVSEPTWKLNGQSWDPRVCDQLDASDALATMGGPLVGDVGIEGSAWAERGYRPGRYVEGRGTRELRLLGPGRREVLYLRIKKQRSLPLAGFCAEQRARFSGAQWVERKPWLAVSRVGEFCRVQETTPRGYARLYCQSANLVAVGFVRFEEIQQIFSWLMRSSEAHVDPKLEEGGLLVLDPESRRALGLPTPQEYQELLDNQLCEIYANKLSEGHLTTELLAPKCGARFSLDTETVQLVGRTTKQGVRHVGIYTSGGQAQTVIPDEQGRFEASIRLSSGRTIVRIRTMAETGSAVRPLRKADLIIVDYHRE